MPPQTPQTSFTFKLTPEQQEILEMLLRTGNYRPCEVPYTIVAVEAPSWKCHVNLYTSGKCLVQGKGAQEFVLNILEPMVLGEVGVGYEDILDPRQLEPHMGVDESGKGDFFGPLCICAAYTDRELSEKLKAAGARDCKQMSDKQVLVVGAKLRSLPLSPFLCCGLALPMLAMVMTYSRSGWVSAALAFAVLFYYGDKRWIPLFLLLGIGLET